MAKIKRRIGNAGRPRKSDLIHDERPQATENLVWLMRQAGDTPKTLSEKINSSGLTKQRVTRQQIAQLIHRMPLKRTARPEIAAIARYYGYTMDQIYGEDLAGGGRMPTAQAAAMIAARTVAMAREAKEPKEAKEATLFDEPDTAAAATTATVAATAAPSPAGPNSEIDQFLATARKLATLSAVASGAAAESGPDRAWLSRAEQLAEAFRGLVR